MDLVGLRNALREWFRGRHAATPAIQAIPLQVPGEDRTFGMNETWMRFSVQTGAATLIGVGTGMKRSRRVCRVFIEVFGQEAVGDGQVSRITTAVEGIWRDAMPAASAPHPDITVQEPSSFERPEPGRYCQVVSVPVQVDLIS